MKTLINNVTIVNEGVSFKGNVVIDGDIISSVNQGNIIPNEEYDQEIDADGCYLLPGIIDDHVHFREPGLTDKADIESESRAAAAGGVTSFFDMPNTIPTTTTTERLEEKFDIAKKKSHVNYTFFLGASSDNLDVLSTVAGKDKKNGFRKRIPGVKLFMGSSTGNMLVEDVTILEKIFSTVTKPLMLHCEDTEIINNNMRNLEKKLGKEPSIGFHPQIRSREACYKSTSLAISLAKKYHTRIHVAHISTSEELGLFDPKNRMITAEATVGHLYFCDEDYEHLGSKIKVNPAIKSSEDRDALRKAINNGTVTVVGTDHAPHLLTQKEGGCKTAASGMPMIQFSLVTMLELVDMGVISLPRLVSLMCHNPATIFDLKDRGYIRKGYKADIVLVRRDSPWIVTKDVIQSKCKWSPVENHKYNWKVEYTFCNGHIVYKKGNVDTTYIGEELEFYE